MLGESGKKVTPKEVLALCREKEVKAVDLRFMDFPGLWQHFTIPVGKLDEDVFEDGLGFDGSSIRGWQAINESDMLVVPQPETAFIDPFTTIPTLVMICNIQDPITREDYSRDPRNVARKAVNYLKSTGIADTCFVGPEAEFFIFDDVRFDQNAHEGYYHIDSIEGEWNRGREESPNLGYKIRYKEGYFPVPPADQMMNIRNEMMQTMIDCGMDVEAQHHEVATAGQSEIDLQLRRPGPDGRQDDDLQVHHQERRHQAQQDRHLHAQAALRRQRLGHAHPHLAVEGGQPLFAGSGYAGLSDMAMYAIGGLLRHAPAILAFSNPTTNSYKRLVPGYEAPVNLAYSPAQSLGQLPHSDVQPQPQGQAGRVPLSRSELQSLPGVLGHADGGDRRHPEQAQPGRAAGQGHLRPGAGRAGRSAQDPRLAGRSLGGPAQRSRVPAARRRFHARRGRHLDLVQDREGSRRDAAAAASLRVLLVLRHLSFWHRQSHSRRRGTRQSLWPLAGIFLRAVRPGAAGQAPGCPLVPAH